MSEPPAEVVLTDRGADRRVRRAADHRGHLADRPRREDHRDRRAERRRQVHAAQGAERGAEGIPRRGLRPGREDDEHPAGEAGQARARLRPPGLQRLPRPHRAGEPGDGRVHPPPRRGRPDRRTVRAVPRPRHGHAAPGRNAQRRPAQHARHGPGAHARASRDAARRAERRAVPPAPGRALGADRENRRNWRRDLRGRAEHPAHASPRALGLHPRARAQQARRSRTGTAARRDASWSSTSAA